MIGREEPIEDPPNAVEGAARSREDPRGNPSRVDYYQFELKPTKNHCPSASGFFVVFIQGRVQLRFTV